MARVYAVSEPDEHGSPEYLSGLRYAVTAALQYGIDAVEQGADHAPIAPPILLSQARLAAHNGVELDAVLRRYIAGYTLLGDFIAQEAGRGDLLAVEDVQRLSRDQATLFNRLLASVTEEYKAAASGRRRSVEDRHSERVRRLLEGELLDTTEFRYEFDEVWHIGVLALGSKAPTSLRNLASALDCRLLLARDRAGIVSAWFGRRERLDSATLERETVSEWPSKTSLAIGEPAKGLPGWRLTHRQARAAFPLAVHHPKRVIRYSDNALPVSMMKDDLLVASLHQLYLAPLAEEPDGGQVSRQTLRAYFAANGNVSSAAAMLQVSRKTVTNRLAQVEKRLGRPIRSCGTELEGALWLDEQAPHGGHAGRSLGNGSPL